MRLRTRLRRTIIGLVLLPSLLIWLGSVAFASHQVASQALREATDATTRARELLRQEVLRDVSFIRYATLQTEGGGALDVTNPSLLLPLFFPYAQKMVIERDGLPPLLWRASDYGMSISSHLGSEPAPGEPLTALPAKEESLIPFGQVMLAPDPVFPAGGLWYRVPIQARTAGKIRVWLQIPTVARWLGEIETAAYPESFSLVNAAGETLWGDAEGNKTEKVDSATAALISGVARASVEASPTSLMLVGRKSLAPALFGLKAGAFLGLFFTCLVIVLSLWLSQRVISKVTDGLMQMEETAERVGSGEFAEMRANPSEGELGRFAAAFNRMVSDLRRLQWERERAARGEALSMAFSALAHDLKNGVGHLALLSENLEKYYLQPGFREDAIASLKAVVQRLVSLSNRISKKGQFASIQRRAALSMVWQGLCERHRTDALRLSSIGAPEAWKTPVPVPAIEDVMEVLLSNARDAGATNFECEAVLAGDALTLLARDDGNGIGEGMKSSLFEAFATSKDGGLGLGLFHARRTLRFIGGELAYEPGGQQTTFKLVIPAREA